jgi:acetylornithine deacetylase/succinyl-diaminopimelate desuccinylase family protein
VEVTEARRSLVERVTRRIEEDRDYVVELTRRLVRQPSVNPEFEQRADLNGEPEAQRIVAEALNAAGMATESYDVFPGRPNLVGAWEGSEERSLIINGHIDVVPVGDESAWTAPPFGAEIRNGLLYGRGSCDMKSGIAAAAAAARALRECGVELAGRLEIHSVVDQESGGWGSQDVVRRGRHASAVIEAHPTHLDIVVAEGGDEWVRVTIRGKSAHAGWRYNDIYPQRDSPNRPVPGVNAAELAARFLIAVGQLERDWGRRKPPHPLLPPGLSTISPGAVQVGSGLGVDGLPQVTTNPAITPDVAVLDFELKFLPNERSEDVRREFEDFVQHWAMQDSWLREHPPSVQWELSGLHFPPFDTSPEHPLVQALVRNASALGGSPELTGFIAVTDAAFYAAAGITSVMFGVRGSNAHGADEWVDVDSIIDVTKVFATTAIDYCGVR